MGAMRLTAALILACLPQLAAAQDFALGGMDPVAYAEEGEAVAGRTDIVTQWAGHSWHFASEDHRAQFEANPRAYAPGFDGYCPVSLAEGRPAPGDPARFVVVGNRLYLVRSDAARAALLADPRRILMQAREAFLAMKR